MFMKSGKEKKKLVIHINNITPEIQDAIKQQYPDGYGDRIFKVTKPNNDFFYAFTVETEEISYLVKVNVKIDTKPKDATELIGEDIEIEKDIPAEEEAKDVPDESYNEEE